MTDIELKSCIGTIEMLRRLHGVMNVIDAGNCEKIIKVLSDIPKYKDAYNKGWDDGAKATYEHLKMCEEEQGGDLISRDAVIEQTYLWSKDEFLRITNPFDYLRKRIKNLPSVNPQEKTGHCEDCKHFRKLPYHADTLGKCVHHTGFCPKGDWYCADFEPQESEE